MSFPRYACTSEERRRIVAAGVSTADGAGTINGVEFVEVVDAGAPSEDLRQRLLLIRCYWPVPALDAGNVTIEGGVRITPVQVLDCGPLEALAASPSGGFAGLGGWLDEVRDALVADAHDDPARYLVALTDVRGDFSTYTLRLISGAGSTAPPAPFDPLLSTASFSFKVECNTDFDCAPPEPTHERPPSPRLDYLARDFASLRRMMLDRMSTTIPEWTERNPADLGVALVEVLAYAGDQVAYMQDAVATEAYLGTARRRTSLRRHARLLDYSIQEGANARTFVHFVVREGQVISGSDADPAVPAGTMILTRVPAGPVVTTGALVELWPQRPTVFETLHALRVLSHAHDAIRFHTWGDTDCCLPTGAIEAALVDPAPLDEPPALQLERGDVLIFEEIASPTLRRREDADPAKRHAVRLVEEPELGVDLVTGVRYHTIRWAVADALPFELCLADVALADVEPEVVVPATVARANVVLVDHGETRLTEDHPDAGAPGGTRRVLGRLDPATPIDSRRFRPRLSEPDLAFAVGYDHERVRDDPHAHGATPTLHPEPRAALPAITLVDADGHSWRPLPDLLSATGTRRAFVVEMEHDRRAWLRFGDNRLGRRPTSALHARYRVGGGPSGNIGRDTLAHVVSDTLDDAIVAVRNPLPAFGGTRPEPDERVRQHAPAAFRVQQRAVTEADWVVAAERHPQVQRAVAELRWTGSWHTVFIAVDRVGGRSADDPAFIAELRAFLEPYRLAGYDLEVDPPIFVPLDIAFSVCVEPDVLAADVEARLLRRLSSRRFGERLGFFHPDRLSFGEPVYLSALVAEVMAEPGVAWIDTSPGGGHRFARLHELPANELAEGVIAMDYLEIAQLDNDPNAPENGRLELYMRGGL